MHSTENFSIFSKISNGNTSSSALPSLVNDNPVRQLADEIVGRSCNILLLVVSCR